MPAKNCNAEKFASSLKFVTQPLELFNKKSHVTLKIRPADICQALPRCLKDAYHRVHLITVEKHRKSLSTSHYSNKQGIAIFIKYQAKIGFN